MSDFLKTIALDIDGPLYEFDKTMRYLLREERGCTGLEQPSPDWLLPGQPWHNVTKEDWKWLWSEGQRLGLFRHGHVTKHAIRAVRTLQRAGWEMHALTHRPQSAFKDTHEWLNFHFTDGVTQDVFTAFKITDESKARWEHAYLLIDDKIENVQEWRETGRPALLFGRPWNAKYALDPGYMDGWNAVLQRLQVQGL